MSYVSSTSLPTLRQRLLHRTQLHVRARLRAAPYSVEGAVRSCDQTGWTIGLHRMQFGRTHVSKVSVAPGCASDIKLFFQRSNYYHTNDTNTVSAPHGVDRNTTRPVGAGSGPSCRRPDTIVSSLPRRQRHLVLRSRRSVEERRGWRRFVLSGPRIHCEGHATRATQPRAGAEGDARRY